MKLTDTHSHLYDTAFNADREEALARAAAAGVEHLLLPGIDSESHGALFDLCRRHPGQCVPMMGLHPTSVNDNPHWREELALAERYLTAPPEGIARFCAVGEIGLDYYWKRRVRRPNKVEAFVSAMPPAASARGFRWRSTPVRPGTTCAGFSRGRGEGRGGDGATAAGRVPRLFGGYRHLPETESLRRFRPSESAAW